MQINNVSGVNFQAKFLKTDDMEYVYNYARKMGKLDELNRARLKIESRFLRYRLKLTTAETHDGYPIVMFTRYTPRTNSLIPKYEQDYNISRPIAYISSTKINTAKFALEKIIKMGKDVNSDSRTNMFKRIMKG